MKNNMMKRMGVIPTLLAILVLIPGCTGMDKHAGITQTAQSTLAVQDAQVIPETKKSSIYSWNGADLIPAYDGTLWSEIHGGVPYFSEDEKNMAVFEEYSELDSLGRCGQAYASICQELMPTEEREQIGQVKPSGWHTVKYPEQIKNLYLYNRCHLIGFQLAGENANEKNLVTGTRYLNIEGMLPFENVVADHVHETGHHVLYRVTPLFEGDNLVCRGVEMEAFCIEDDGNTDEEGVSFHVFVYNVQSGIEIDYVTGESWVEGSVGVTAGSEETQTDEQQDAEGREYALNINTQKFHLPGCASMEKANPENIKYWTCTRQELIEDGYAPCGACHP